MTIKDTKFKDIETALKAVGKEIFVSFFYDFKFKQLGISDLSRKIFNENYRSKSLNQNRRIYRAYYIFDSHSEIDALNIIINSPKISDIIKKKAKEIIENEIKESSVEKDINKEQYFIKNSNDILENFIYIHSEPKQAKLKKEYTYRDYNRSIKESANALSKANFLCELSSKHPLFLRKKININYTEPHHLVPLSASKDFPEIDLDREQNIISLCSNCHNQLHYGRDIKDALRQLYDIRKELLKSVGINITFDKLLDYYK